MLACRNPHSTSLTSVPAALPTERAPAGGARVHEAPAAVESRRVQPTKLLKPQVGWICSDCNQVQCLSWEVGMTWPTASIAAGLRRSAACCAGTAGRHAMPVHARCTQQELQTPRSAQTGNQCHAQLAPTTHLPPHSQEVEVGLERPQLRWAATVPGFYAVPVWVQMLCNPLTALHDCKPATDLTTAGQESLHLPSLPLSAQPRRCGRGACKGCNGAIGG